MSIERTFSIIKPNAVKKGVIGPIIERFEKNGLKVAAMKLTTLDKIKTEVFYAEHAARPFFGELVSFMISGPVVLMVLEGENAVARNREIMGATDPAKAAAGTIRKDFGDSLGENSVHGSDSLESARCEIAHFFYGAEIVNTKI